MPVKKLPENQQMGKQGIKKRTFWKREQMVRKKEEEIRDRVNESYYVWDKDGNIIDSSDKGDDSSCTLNNMDYSKVEVFTHNHPDIDYSDGINIPSGVFSAGTVSWVGGRLKVQGDMAVLTYHNMPEFRASDTEKTYVIRRLGDKWHSSLREDYEKARIKGREIARERANKLLAQNPTMTRNDYERYSFEQADKYRRTWLKNNASKYGYEYHEYSRRRSVNTHDGWKYRKLGLGLGWD